MFGKILEFLDKILTWFEEWTLFASVMTALLALFVNVVLRYVFNYTLAWSEELVREVIIYTTFIGCSAAIKNRSMIRIDASVQLLPKMKVPLTFFSNIVTMIFSGMMIYYGWKMAPHAGANPPENHYPADSPRLSICHFAADGGNDAHSYHPGDVPGCISKLKTQAAGIAYMETSHVIIMLILLGCMATYIPVFMCLFFTAVLGFMLFTDLPLLLLAQSLFRSMDKFALVVVLFFILCGNIMTAGSIVEKLIKVANSLVSWLPGGLGMAGVLACGLFGAISGSTVATVVALGGFMIPALLENGYDEKYTLGLMTTSPNLGVIIPPSIGMILYSMVSNVSLEGLFLTGFLPGVLIMAGVCIYTYFFYRNDKTLVRMPVPSGKELLMVLKEGFWSLMLPVIIFGGIFSGFFTANEAAVVACVYAFVVELCIHRSMKFNQVKSITVSSAVTSATLLIIVAGATCFGRLLTLEDIPGKITETVLSTISSPVVFLLALNGLLLVVGMFMDIISATMILGPVFLPMLDAFNVDWMHFGLILTVNLAIGYCTPPMGVSLYITGAIANRDLIFVSKAVLPFILIQLCILLFITYFPEAVLWLPRMMGYAG